jgi:UDPglucose 6-dehydrogenase
LTRTRETGPRVGVAGLGYMGLATGLAFAAHGLPVFGYDINPEIRATVALGSSPYREAGLEKLLKTQVRSKRFRVVDNPKDLVDRAEGIFLCVPTPSLRNGRINLHPLKRSAKQIGSALKESRGYHVVVVKSTVVPGTTEGVVAPLIHGQSCRSPEEVGVAANPEFLAEGTMVRDALHPDRIVLGTNDSRSLAWLNRAYRTFGAPVFNLTPSGAELVKYAANAFLALKVSFANEISRLAEGLDSNVDHVMAAVGRDPRIGERFLRAGPGFGGSCFEKDLKALVVRAHELGVMFRSGETALAINQDQTKHVMTLVRKAAGPLEGKQVAVLGVAFKAGTDDVRESRAFPLVSGLVRDGAHVRVHDPTALSNFQREWIRRPSSGPGSVEFSRSVLESLAGADVAILQADWPEYKRWRPEWTRRMKEACLVDLRRSVEVRTKGDSGLRILALGIGFGPTGFRSEVAVPAARRGGKRA